MDELTKKYAYHFDEIRRKRKMTVKQLTENICNDRSYRRYLSGERVMSQDKIHKFCDRLGINPLDFFNTFVEKDDLEYGKVLKCYKHLMNENFDEVKKNISILSKMTFNNPSNESLFKLIVVRFDELTKRISSYSAFEKYCQLIDYPYSESIKVYDFVDLLALIYISDFETRRKEFKSNDHLLNIVNNEELIYLSSDQKYILSTIYYVLSFNLGREGRFEESVEVALKGLNFCKMNVMNDKLPQLHYLISLGNYKLGKIDLAINYGAKCLLSFIVIEDYEGLKHYKRRLYKDFDINPKDYVLKEIEKYLK